MNTKALTVTATGIMLAAFALGAAAAPGNMDNHPNKAGHEQGATKPHMQDKSNPSPGNDSRDNENSNRQSDPDSTRGLDRAEERRAEQADEHAQSGKERHWYDFLFGEDGDKDMGKKEPRWWWPFN